MRNKQITIKIGQAIREGKYLDITYKNKQEEVKHFWISILDITSKTHSFLMIASSLF